MAANGISTLATKEARQLAKLDLAATDRAADGNPRAQYDISLLPTQYEENGIINNINTGGLVQGRPWITGSGKVYYEGLWRDTYTGYFNDDPNFFVATLPSGFGFPSNNITASSIAEYTSIEWRGFFVPPSSGTYTFYTNSDDASYLWIGDIAVSGFTTLNALVNNGGLHGLQEASGSIALVEGTYYPIRIQAGNNQVAGQCFVSWSSSFQAQTGTFTDLVFYKQIVNGF